MTNSLAINMEVYNANEKYKADGIVFTNTAIIKIFINHRDIHEDNDFKDCLIYFPELLRSIEGSGKYLIFTCACGVADDGGWDYVDIKHEDNKIKWMISINDRDLTFSFEKYQYHNEIMVVKEKIEKMQSDIRLEPEHVTFPE